MTDVAATSSTSQQDFQYFIDIIDACRRANASAVDGNLRHIKVGPFLESMTIFLRIFDAFNNPLFIEGVKKDVLGNIGVSYNVHCNPAVKSNYETTDMSNTDVCRTGTTLQHLETANGFYENKSRHVGRCDCRGDRGLQVIQAYS